MVSIQVDCMMNPTYFAELAASNASRGCGRDIVVSVKSNEVTATSQSPCICLTPRQLQSLCIMSSRLCIVCSRHNMLLIFYSITLQNRSFEKISCPRLTFFWPQCPSVRFCGSLLGLPLCFELFPSCSL